MKLRSKYFFLLLLASLVPMLAVTIISQKASKKLGHSISSQIQKEITGKISKEIVFATENYALITRGAKSSMEFALHALKGRIEGVLHKPSPGSSKIYFADDFDDPGSAPGDSTSSQFHMEIMPDSSLKAKRVSYQHPSFLLAPGVSKGDVTNDIEKLALVTPDLKGIASGLGDQLFWIYASLESGVHISFPGHGGYPEGYDPRLRPWYIRAKNQGELCWGEPVMDITTRQLAFTASAPFYNADGSFAGVTAIDILVPDVLLKNQISSQWSDAMESFLIGQSDMTAKGKKHLWILSRKDLENPSEDMEKKMKNEGALTEDQKDFYKLIPYLNDKRSGGLEMAYQGVDSLWAYAEIFPDLHFVIIAPKSMVTGLSKDIGDSFYGYSIMQTLNSMAAIFIVIVIVSGIAFILSRTNTRKVMSIVRGFKRLEQGDYSVRLNEKFSDERNLIVTTFNQIIPKLAEHLRMSRALGLAKDVQQSLLPGGNPVLAGFDIAGTSIYCDETGGDYYDFIKIEDNRLAVVVGDVSGHGVSSSLLMATARALIMLRASMPGPAASIINDVNKHLSLDTYDSGNFMTFFYCELTESKLDVNWVRAGHDPAILYDPASDSFDELKGRGLAFGVDYTFEYEEFQRTLSTGQILLIGTDGIWEMRNEQGEMFGKERLRMTIKENVSQSSKELLVSITHALKKFRGTKKTEDDVTMVAIKVK
jgi:sigma-B regulation protein RsbU (phosphoserine phosphatase)